MNFVVNNIINLSLYKNVNAVAPETFRPIFCLLGSIEVFSVTEYLDIRI